MQRLVLLTVLLQSATALLTTNNTEWAKKTKIEPPAEKPTGAPIFYAVIMGRLAFRHQVSLWLTSVRKIGGWRGEAVIVTDKPFCLSETLKEAGLLGEKLSSSDAVDIFGPGQGYSGNLHMVKRPNAHSINMMKLEKARGWLNVKVAEIPHPVTSIVYTDEDVVIGKDLTFFMREVRTLETLKHTLDSSETLVHLLVSCTLALWSCFLVPTQTSASKHGARSLLVSKSALLSPRQPNSIRRMHRSWR
jgi:hypothetical protein